jgi:hypothetical protein
MDRSFRRTDGGTTGKKMPRGARKIPYPQRNLSPKYGID